MRFIADFHVTFGLAKGKATGEIKRERTTVGLGFGSLGPQSKTYAYHYSLINEK